MNAQKKIQRTSSDQIRNGNKINFAHLQPDNRLNGLVGWVLSNGPGDLAIHYTRDAMSCVEVLKVEQSKERNSALPYTSV